MRRFRRSATLALLVVAATCIAAGSVAQADVVVAEDFWYNQPTKATGGGGGFSDQDYGGGQNGPAGNWIGRWDSSGDAIINGPDHTPEENQYMAEYGPTFGNLTYLFRDYGFNGLANDQTLFFAVSMRAEEAESPSARMYLNGWDVDANDPAQISIGFDNEFSTFVGYLGETQGIGFTSINDGIFHRIVGKLEINASGANERLTVWMDPTGVETGRIDQRRGRRRDGARCFRGAHGHASRCRYRKSRLVGRCGDRHDVGRRCDSRSTAGRPHD